MCTDSPIIILCRRLLHRNAAVAPYIVSTHCALNRFVLTFVFSWIAVGWYGVRQNVAEAACVRAFCCTLSLHSAVQIRVPRYCGVTIFPSRSFTRQRLTNSNDPCWYQVTKFGDVANSTIQPLRAGQCGICGCGTKWPCSRY